MKTKKILVALVLMVMSCCFVCLGCGKNEKDPPANVPTEVLIDGVDVESVEIYQIESQFICDLFVSNKTENDLDLDLSQMVFKLNKTTELEHDGALEIVLTGEENHQITLEIYAGESGLKEGDSVSVYYKNEFLLKTTVEEF